MRTNRIISTALAAVLLLTGGAAATRPAVSASAGFVSPGAKPECTGNGTTVVLPAAEALWENAALHEKYAGEPDAVVVEEGGWLEWETELPVAGAYTATVVYCPVEDTGMDMEVALHVDGAPALAATDRYALPRLWEDDPAGRPDRFAVDNRGNELVPHRRERFEWTESRLRSDSEQLARDAVRLELAAGRCTIRLELLRECMAVKAVRLEIPAALTSWREIYEEQKAAGAQDVPQQNTVELEAELTSLRSNSAIYPGYDRSTPSTSPNNPARIRLNTIGGDRWSRVGDWIAWEFTVEADGFYLLSFKFRQDRVRGLSVSRRIRIDGEVPFAEFETVAFPYGSQWDRLTPADAQGEPCRLYLEAGRHELRMEAVAGAAGESVERLQKIVLELNTIYRHIVMVTGTSPDFYRDYYLDTEIPDLTDRLRQAGSALREEAGRLERAGSGGNQAAFIYEVIRQAEDFARDSRTIPERLSRFKGNIGSLAELVAGLKDQPLELDTIAVASPAQAFTRPNAGFLDQAVFRLRSFLASFGDDYAAVGNVYDGAQEKPLSVWVSVNDLMQSGVASGRDQAQMLSRMIDEYFTPDTGIPVNLSLVNTAEALLQAVMGGKGPDAALFVPEATPINLAMRGALVDLSALPGFAEVYARTHGSAWIAYAYNGGYYAVPETQTFQMMFYRKDIFAELGLKPPNTWEEFYTVVSRLQKKNMQAGIPESQSVFEMLLLQQGGRVYSEDLSQTALDTGEALEAFRMWTDLYLQYSLPLAFDFFNRFRTGEMPLGITSYVMYSQLSVAAPEIRGLWAMLPVPGFEREGRIRRTQSCTGTAGVLLSASGRQEDGWRFLSWWTTADTQKAFGNEMEAVLGASARYTTASTKAFEQLPWTHEEQQSLLAQWEDVSDIPLTPASYYISRNLTNAFRKVVYSYENPREVLAKYVGDMNRELGRKREEFGLDKGGAP